MVDHHYVASSLQAGASASLKQAPISGLYDALKQMSEATAMVRNVADQLCGGQPEAIGEEGVNAKSSSYFGQIDDIAADFRAQANRIVNDMQRVLGRL